MSLENILLGMLRDPASGYSLRKAFESGARQFWSAGFGQLYPALQRMQRRGLLSSRLEPSPRGPKRRVYQRTPAGTRRLHSWLRRGPEIDTERLAYIGQLVFMGELSDRSQTREFLLQLRQSMATKQEQLLKEERRLRESRDSEPALWSGDDLHELLCLRFGVRTLEARVTACDECIELLGVEATSPRTRRGHANGLGEPSRASRTRRPRSN